MAAPLLLGDISAVQIARDAIARVRRAGSDYVHAVAMEAAVLREKPAAKVAALLRVMEAENPLTKRRHSCSSAESVLELDPEYRAFNQRLTKAAVQRELTRTECIVTRLEAQLALALLLDDQGEEE